MATHICDSIKRQLKAGGSKGIQGEFGIGLRTGKSNGEFIGGADIVREMYQSGELQKLLEGLRQQA